MQSSDFGMGRVNLSPATKKLRGGTLMKRTTALYAVTALAALSFAGQAFARGGSMGGGQGHGSTGGTHQMASTMQPGSGNGMQQRTMQSNGSQQGPAAGSGPQTMRQGGLGGNAGLQTGQMNANGTGPTTTQPPATSVTN
jgi:hypothetical protein